MRVPEAFLSRLLVKWLRSLPGIIDVQTEVPIGPGMRVDILARQEDGQLILFELKAHSLTPSDVHQISRYLDRLHEVGNESVLAHLVGDGWTTEALSLRPEEVAFQDWVGYWRMLS